MRDACKKHGGFYLASIGGAAANLAEHCIKKVECVEYPELGMEAIWRIEVVDFPAFIVIDDKGNDFFKELKSGVTFIPAEPRAALSRAARGQAPRERESVADEKQNGRWTLAPNAAARTGLTATARPQGGGENLRRGGSFVTCRTEVRINSAPQLRQA